MASLPIQVQFQPTPRPVLPKWIQDVLPGGGSRGTSISSPSSPEDHIVIQIHTGATAPHLSQFAFSVPAKKIR